jgi:hypothetical protein
VDLIFMSMSFHHFADPIAAAGECRRVLQDGHDVVVRTGTRERISAYPAVPFFPSSRALLEEHLPDAARLREVFESAGFGCVASEVVTQTIALGWAAYADKLSAGGDSIIARLSRQELEDGLLALRRRTTEHDEPIVEPVDLFVFR